MVCVVFRLKRSVTPHFWVNIVDPRFEIPGIIEFSNLRAARRRPIVYVPYYMPTTHPKCLARTTRSSAARACAICRLNPALTEDDLVAFAVGRLRHAQPVCPPGFAAMLPPIQTPIRGLQIADTCFYYPGGPRHLGKRAARQG